MFVDVKVTKNLFVKVAARLLQQQAIVQMSKECKVMIILVHALSVQINKVGESEFSAYTKT